MIYEKIHLNSLYHLKNDPILEIFKMDYTDAPSEPKRRAILTLPGGGYYFCSKREKDAICLKFNLLGYVSFSLIYSTTDRYESPLYPEPYLETMAAISFIKRNADKYNIDAEKITLVGFSAGGHLASSYPLVCNDKKLQSLIKLDEDLNVQSLILSYPVISLLDFTHLDSSKNLTGEDKELKAKLSANISMDDNYPRSFIWATENDDCVPVENSKMISQALKKNNIDHQLLLFKEGPHGLSLATYPLNEWLNHKYEDEISIWPVLADKFIRKND